MLLWLILDKINQYIKNNRTLGKVELLYNYRQKYFRAVYALSNRI